MSQIRVLIVDDAAAVRQLVKQALADSSEISVVGTAVNGRDGLQKIAELQADVVLLDVEMPEMDGLATLNEIRGRYPDVIVIMVSSYTLDGAAVTVEALARGAADYLTKPQLSGGVDAAVEYIRENLIPKIMALCSAAVAEEDGTTITTVPDDPAIAPASRRVDIVAIGTSVGGPAALSAILPQLPADFPVPIVIVQHMPPEFTTLLSESLAAKCRIQVAEGQSRQIIRPGTAVIAPGDYHMVVEEKRNSVVVGTNQNPHVHSCRPAVDELFASVAAVYGSGTLALVLTGMGQDGANGCQRIHDAGGRIWVQDEASSVVWGMPGAVARSGLANEVLGLNEISDKLIRTVKQNRSRIESA